MATEALRRLTSSEPPQFLSPSPELSAAARSASQYLFSSLKPHTPKPSPFDRLLIEGFDAEQIWQQIDLQSQPLVSHLRREVKKLEKNPEVITEFFDDVAVGEEKEEEKDDYVAEESEDLEDDDDDLEEIGSDEDGGGDDVEEGESEEEGSDGEGVEDRFLKVKELENYLRKDEEREYGEEKGSRKNKKKGVGRKASEEEEEEEDDEDDELEIYGAGMDDDEEDDEMGNARYEDFFGSEKRIDQKRKPKLSSRPKDLGNDSEEDDDMDNAEYDDVDSENDDGKAVGIQKHSLSTHEKEQEKLRSEIEQMEQANLEPKTWTMQGEVTAAKRPKNSALEVDLDFEHNVRPAPVITEEVTAALEELIQKRILEGHFDDVQKAPSLQSKAPKEYKELDENKSKKGLAEIYEDEFVQKTGLVSTALTFSDEQKKEASMLFKKLCLKLDALSHFHFSPKPVVEDMSIQANVPALAMEEIAPLAVSDAAMLAPEEVFAGQGDIKEETELTQAERKRRRANKKRKYKAETVKLTALKKARESNKQSHDDVKL